MKLGISLKLKISGKKASTPSLYQEWTTYPNSPELTATYPYQCIFYQASNNYHGLALSSVKLWHTDSAPNHVIHGSGKVYYMIGVTGTWIYNTVLNTTTSIDATYAMEQANYDIYTSSAYETVYFTKTTP